MSELLAIGISHKTAPVEVRERLALTDARAAEFVRDLHGVPDVQEVVALSTCNRTELYLVVDDPVEAESTVLGMLARQASIRPTALAGAIYSHRNCEAARHLYRVSSGLESMIVGEDQIQGQVRRAYDAALERETTGPLTNHLFRAALSTGKRVRSETAIGEGNLSLPSVSAMLASEALGDLRGRRVVIIGTGESSELAARALADAGCELVFVATRRRDRAVSLAARFEPAVSASTSCRRRWSGRRGGVCDRLTAPVDRCRGVGSGPVAARWPPAADHRPRGPTRCRRRLR